jgi:uncharacterized membrane protein YjjP (DUF1212 family)
MTSTSSGGDPVPTAASELLQALGGALLEVGQPTHRLDENLERAAKRLGLKVELFTVPTAIFLSLDDRGGRRTILVRRKPGPVDLNRLTRLTATAESFIRGDLTPTEARREIEVVRVAESPWGLLATAAAYILSAAGFSVFFGGGPAELFAGAAVGLAVGCVALAFRGRQGSGRAFELVAAAAAALSAHLAETLVGPVVEWVPLASGLITLLPGLAMVDAVEELAYGRLVAGAARLAGVAVVFLALTFGTLIGFKLGEIAPRPQPVLEPPTPLGLWATFVALPVVAVGSCVRFRAAPSDAWPILLGSAAAWLGARWGAALAGPLAGPFLAMMGLGVAANVYAWRRRRPAELVLVPGLALLVPGSVGVRAISAMLINDTSAGVNAAFEMVLIAMALAAGLLFSNALLRPRSAD